MCYLRLKHLRHISIHALREEGDICETLDRLGFTISIHALREEGDLPEGWEDEP